MLQQFILPRSLPRDGASERIARFIAHLPAETAYRVEVHEHRATRSNQQNRYLWGVVYPTVLKAGKLEGWEAQDLHEFLLGEHFGWETVEGFGKKRLRPLRRSSRLSKMEFVDYVDFIQRKMAGLGIYIPNPDDDSYFGEDAA